MRRSLLGAALACLLSSTATAQKTFDPSGRASSPRSTRWYLATGAFATEYRNPFLREPHPEGSSGSELQTRQIVNVMGGRLGVGLRGARWAGEAVFSYWQRADLADFEYFNPETQSDTSLYSDVSVGMWQVDLLFAGAPIRGVPLWAYGVLGMGRQNKHFTVSNHSTSFYNGRRELGEMSYTPGVGLRVLPIRLLGLFGEVRFVPGDQTTTIPQEGCYITTVVPARVASPMLLSVRGARAPLVEECRTNTDYGMMLTVGGVINLP